MSVGPAQDATAERDPFDARLALQASGPLREFNLAGVLSAADIHVARRLGALGGESDDEVLLAVALAVRAPRIGHVLVDLHTIRDTVAVDTEDPIDLDALHWPDAGSWVASVAASPLVALEDSGEPAVRPLRLRGSWLYLDRYWAEEVAVARTLSQMLQAPEFSIDEARLRSGLARLFGPDAPDDRQADAVAAAVRRRFAVVAGGPGTGKTTTVARIVALLCEQAGSDQRPPRVALAAPTGKAAARLEQAVREEARKLDVSEDVRRTLLGLRSSTIHRLLGWRPGSSTRFRHDRHRRLPHDVVIVDETSMVSLSLMARLIEALRSDARLVLIGDPGQLASIEAGAVLGDIVDADRAATHPGGSHEGIVVLDRGHRFGGAIASLATAIRDGDGDRVMELLSAGTEDVRWIDGDAGRCGRRGQSSRRLGRATARGRCARSAGFASSARTGAGPMGSRAGRPASRAGSRAPSRSSPPPSAGTSGARCSSRRTTRSSTWQTATPAWSSGRARAACSLPSSAGVSSPCSAPAGSAPSTPSTR
jgi:exodeoxyribonuclease V alpha subunit